MYQLIYIFYLTAFQLIISSVSQWFSSLFNALQLISSIHFIGLLNVLPVVLLLVDACTSSSSMVMVSLCTGSVHFKLRSDELFNSLSI